MKKYIIFILLTVIAFAQPRKQTQWRDLSEAIKDSVRNASGSIGDSLDVLRGEIGDSLDILTGSNGIVYSGRDFSQKIVRDTTTAIAYKPDSVGTVIFIQGYGLYEYKDSGTGDTYNVFEVTGGGAWHKTPFNVVDSLANDSLLTGRKGTVYYNTTDSTLHLNDGSNFKQIYSSNDKIGATDYENPLTIPTYDGNPATTHPDVAYFSNGWNGYRYWMAFTPYPTIARENPSIVASNDGIKWIEPKGISNPIAPLADAVADGFVGQSDPDLIYYADTLFMYYRPILGAPGEGIYRRYSDDGITWGGKTEILKGGVDIPAGVTDFVALSPAMVNIGDSIMYMYTVCDTGSGITDYQLLRWTSTDGGRNFTTPATICDYQRLKEDGATVQWSLWHIDVVYHDLVYYMLGVDVLSTQNHFYRYRWFKSTDGLNFTKMNGEMDSLNTDNTWNYRASAVVRKGNPFGFDVWGVAVADTGGGSTVFTNTHRIVYYSDVRLKDLQSSNQNFVHLNRPITGEIEDTLSIAAQFTWANITGWTKTYSSGTFTFANDTLTALVSGLYELNGYVTVRGYGAGDAWQIRFETSRGAADTRYQPIEYVDDDFWHTIPYHGLVNMFANDTAVLQIRNLTDASDAIVHHGVLTLKRLLDAQ
jgi:hypothetical protein